MEGLESLVVCVCQYADCQDVQIPFPDPGHLELQIWNCNFSRMSTYVHTVLFVRYFCLFLSQVQIIVKSLKYLLVSSGTFALHDMFFLLLFKDVILKHIFREGL